MKTAGAEKRGALLYLENLAALTRCDARPYPFGTLAYVSETAQYYSLQPTTTTNATTTIDAGQGTAWVQCLSAAGVAPPAPAASNQAFFVSPADRGLIRAAGTAGNFTVGMAFVFFQACTWTGVRFSCVYAGTKTWKVRAYDLTASAALAAATSAAPLPSGTSTVLFASPVTVTDASHIYVVSAYDTSPGLFPGYTPATGPDSWAAGGILGPNVYLVDDSLFSAGDSQPTSGGSSTRMAVEPVFTIP